MKAFSIEGFTSQTELKWLAQLAHNHYAIAEIGCWRGRSTVAMAESTPGVISAIDTWKGSPELMYQLEDRAQEWLYQEFIRNTREFPNIQPYRMTSLDAAKMFSDNGMKFDMVFIDASHTYEDVKDDIAAWLPLVSPGGILVGDDLQHQPEREAVKEAFPMNGEVLTNGKLWMVMR